MNVLMIGTFPTPSGSVNGGVVAATTYLSGALVRTGNIKVTGISLETKATEVTFDVHQGIGVYRLPIGNRNLLSNFEKSVQFAKTIADDIRPDIIHAQGIDLAGYIACQLKFPKIITIHGVLHKDALFQSTFDEKIREGIFAQRFTKACFAHCNDFISISPYVKQVYRKQLCDKSIYDIPNTIADSFFIERRNVESGRILFLGRVNKRKGLDDLIEALNLTSLANWSLNVAGAISDLKYKNTVDRRAKQLNLQNKIKYLGLLDELQVIHELSIAACVVLPSHQETAPMVVQQALALGCPIVASNICGIPHQLGHGRFGFLFPRGDIRRLSEKITEALNNYGNKAEQMAASGMAMAKEAYYPAKIAGKTLNAYAKVLAQ